MGQFFAGCQLKAVETTSLAITILTHVAWPATNHIAKSLIQGLSADEKLTNLLMMIKLYDYK